MTKPKALADRKSEIQTVELKGEKRGEAKGLKKLSSDVTTKDIQLKQ